MSDVTSPCTVEVSPAVLSDPAAVLFGLEDKFAVLHVERTAPNSIKVVFLRPGRLCGRRTGHPPGRVRGPGQRRQGLRAPQRGPALVAHQPGRSLSAGLAARTGPVVAAAAAVIIGSGLVPPV